MTVLVRVVGGLAAAIVVVGCLDRPAFECADHSECRASDESGFCEADGFCSFEDDACASGRRFGELASDVLSDQCVVDKTPCFSDPSAASFEAGAPFTAVTVAGSIMIAERDDSLFQLVQSSGIWMVRQELGSLTPARRPSLSADGRTIYFERNTRLFSATRGQTNKAFSSPITLSFATEIGNNQSDAFVTADGSLYFLSGETPATKSLYLAASDGGSLGDPIAVSIDFDGVIEAPAVSEGQLFFSSAERGKDLFVSHQARADWFAPPVVLPDPLNGASNETVPSPNGTSGLFFASNRDGGIQIFEADYRACQ